MKVLRSQRTRRTSGRRLPLRLQLWSLEDRLLPAAAITPAFTPEVQVSNSQTQNFPDVGVAGTGAYAGTFDVVYQQTSGTTSTVLVKRYNADGTPLAAALGPNTITVDTSNGADPMQRIAVRADGSFVVVYRQPSGPADVETIAAKIYNADGSLRKAVSYLATDLTQDETTPAVAIQDATGTITAVWVETVSSSSSRIFFRRLDVAGNFLSPMETQLAFSPPAGSLLPIIVANGHDPAIDSLPSSLSPGAVDTVITYTSSDPGRGILGARLDSSGKTMDYGPLRISTSGTMVSHSSVAVDAAGEFVVAWEDDSGPVANIVMHRFDKDGASQSPGNTDEVVDNSPNGDKTSPSVARADDGRFIVSFRDNALMGEALPPNHRIAYRQFARDGAPVGTKRTLSAFAVPGANPVSAASGSGIFAIAADEQGPSGMGHFDTFARTFREQPPTFFAVASAPNQVTVYRVADGSVYGTLTPFTAYNGGVTVAWGDVNGDGYPDLVVAATAGNPAIKVYNGNFLATSAGAFFARPDDYLLGQGFVYGYNLNIGVNLAVGDIEGNGFADIVTAPTSGNPHVKIFSGQQISNGGVIPLLPQPPHAFNPDNDPAVVAQGFVYGLNFNVGANLAVADIEGNGRADVITGASAGNPHVKVYSGQQVIALGEIGTLGPNTADAGLRTSFFAYQMGLNIGVFVAAGDVDGDGVPDIITGASAGNPEVRTYRGADLRAGTFNPDVPDNSLIDHFYAYELGMDVGVSVGAADFDGDGLADIVTGSVNRNPVLYRVFKTNPDHTHTTLLNGIQGSPAGLTGDLSVGVQNLQNSRF
jgi:hypothetical protein